MFPGIFMEADLTRKIPVTTRKRNELVDITSTIRGLIDESGVSEGICHIFVPHTTAAVTINEKADPAVASDISNTLEKIVPADWGYRHAESGRGRQYSSASSTARVRGNVL
jgi:secondary thiamine-phosphate synthase enzyme